MTYRGDASIRAFDVARTLLGTNGHIRFADLAETAAEVRDGRHPAKEFLDIVDRRLLDEVGPEMMGRILQHHPEIFEVEAVAQRAFDADIGGDAHEHDIADAACAQSLVELRVEEGRIA